ncbi:MAG: hypothetical protein WBW69_02365 [Candidatus Korobacteraceae bacterium]
MTPMTLKILRRIVLVVFACSFTWFMVELPAITGLLDYRSIMGPFHAWWAPNVSDPELLTVHRPHAQQTGSSRGGSAAIAYRVPASDLALYQWDVRYDRHGFRNPDAMQRAGIAVIGDSFVEDLTVPGPELMTSRLAALQGEPVANLGQATYGPQQEFVVLKRYALPLHPHTILWLFSEASDLGDVLYYDRTINNPPGFWHDAWRRSFTRRVYYMIKHSFNPSQKPDGAKYSGIFPAADGQRRTLYFNTETRPLNQEELGALHETVNILSAAQDLAAADGIRLVFVFVPMKFRVYQPYCDFPAASLCSKWGSNDLAERLQKVLAAEAAEIEYVDLTPVLRKAASQGVLTYYADDDHWSPEGNRVVAQFLNEYLATKNTAVRAREGQ